MHSVGACLGAAHRCTAAPAAHAAVLIGVSPVGRLLIQPTAAAAWAADSTIAAAASAAPPVSVPWELELIKATLGSVWDVLEMLSGATLALQALVLASSLFGSAPPSTARSQGGSGQAEGEVCVEGEGGPSTAGGAGAVEVLDGDGTTILSSSAAHGVGADAPPAVQLQFAEAKDADAASAHVLGQLWPQGTWE